MFWGASWPERGQQLVSIIGSQLYSAAMDPYYRDGSIYNITQTRMLVFKKLMPEVSQKPAISGSRNRTPTPSNVYSSSERQHKPRRRSSAPNATTYERYLCWDCCCLSNCAGFGGGDTNPPLRPTVLQLRVTSLSHLRENRDASQFLPSPSTQQNAAAMYSSWSGFWESTV